MARRKKGTPPPKPFEAAFPLIDKLEINVVDQTVDTNFSPEDMVRWLYEPHVVEKLKAAHPLTRPVDRGSYIAERITLPVVFPAVTCNFTIQTKPVAMLVPAPGLARVGLVGENGKPIMASLEGAYTQHMRFETVRRVVRWLNDCATVGAARHYCPWLTSLLPVDHPFQEASGTIYREPSRSMTEIIPAMRECGAIMASALLCADLEKTRGDVAVSFQGARGSDTYSSQAFWLA